MYASTSQQQANIASATRDKRGRSVASKSAEESDDDSLTPEEREKREKERRFANNARERFLR